MNDPNDALDPLPHDRFLARVLGHSPASWRTHLRDDARRRTAAERDATLLRTAGDALVELGLLRDLLDSATDPPATARYLHHVTLPAATLHARAAERAICDIHHALARRSADR